MQVDGLLRQKSEGVAYMKIAIVLPPWFKVPPKGYGGIEIVVSLLADGLVDRGHDVTLCSVASSTTKGKVFSVFDHSQRESLDGPPSSFLNTALTHSLASYLEVAKGDFDVVHDNTWKEGVCSAAFMNTPVVHTLHGPLDDDNKKFYSLLKGHAGMQFVTISDYQQTCLPGLNYAATVYNGIKLEEYPYSEEKDDFFCYLGRFNSEKAPHLACEVAKKLGAKLVMAGKVNEEAERKYFDQYVKPHLSDDITYIGELGHWSEEKMWLFSRAKAYLYPIQWEEPFGITMVEAMACGTPVITNRRGSAPEVVADGETGFVLDNMDDFIDAVKRIDEISPKACRDRVEKMFTADHMVEGYERVFQNLLK
jgi:glycosyltransferase involved in cell wall biosynthesis